MNYIVAICLLFFPLLLLFRNRIRIIFCWYQSANLSPLSGNDSVAPFALEYAFSRSQIEKYISSYRNIYNLEPDYEGKPIILLLFGKEIAAINTMLYYAKKYSKDKRVYIGPFDYQIVRNIVDKVKEHSQWISIIYFGHGNVPKDMKMLPYFPLVQCLDETDNWNDDSLHQFYNNIEKINVICKSCCGELQKKMDPANSITLPLSEDIFPLVEKKIYHI